MRTQTASMGNVLPKGGEEEGGTTHILMGKMPLDDEWLGGRGRAGVEETLTHMDLGRLGSRDRGKVNGDSGWSVWVCGG